MGIRPLWRQITGQAGGEAELDLAYGRSPQARLYRCSASVKGLEPRFLARAMFRARRGQLLCRGPCGDVKRVLEVHPSLRRPLTPHMRWHFGGGSLHWQWDV